MSSKAPRRESRALRSTAQETPIDTAEAHTVNTVIETSQEHQLATSDTAVTVGQPRARDGPRAGSGPRPDFVRPARWS